MRILKRGLLALSVLAVAGSATGGILASTASATSTRGPEVIRSTQYTVGDGFGVGPFTSHGVVNQKGVVTDIPPAPKDPPNTNRHTLVDPTGSFTVITNQGTQGPFSMNPNTCQVRFTIRDVDARLIPGTGTGVYRNATGDFNATVRINGYLSRTPQGCDQNMNDPLAFSTTNVVAVGHINLH